MTRPRRFALHAFRRDALLCIVAFALWFSTSLGVLHRTLHDPSVPHPTIVSVASPLASKVFAKAGDGFKPGHGSAGWTALFGDHSDADCRLYDQLSHGAAVPCVPAVVLPVMLPAATFAFLEGEALARWVALFDARGPPSVR